MTLRYVNTDLKCDIAKGCDNVTVCLVDGWETKTKSGVAIAEARVVTVLKTSTPWTEEEGCSAGDPVTVCVESCRYQLEIDDAQFEQDPETSEPYLITDADVGEIMPFPCHIDKLIAGLSGDEVLDTDNVSVIADDVANTFTITFPVIDNFTGLETKTVDVTIPGSQMGLALGVIQHISGPGKVTDVAICDAVEACIGGFSVAADDASCPFVPDPEGFLVEQLSVAAYETTYHRVPEHTSIAETVYFSKQDFVGAGPIATIANGNSAIKTAAYVETTFNNPSSCRPMKVTITATGSISLQGTPASGGIIWGHSIWINGVLVANRNGRNVSGFNISWTSHSGVLEDHALPTIIVDHEIPAGGSVVVGLDFGDNDSYPSTGTTEALSLEPRQISVVGSTAQHG